LLDPSNDPEFFWQVISGPPCIVSNRIKKYEEKGVGPNAGEVICKGCHGLSSVETDEQLSSLTGVTFTVFTHILGLLNIVLHGNEKIN
jgi:hypothetical protein